MRLAVKLNDLGLSLLGFELATFRLRGERSKPLRHCRGQGYIILTKDVHDEWPAVVFWDRTDKPRGGSVQEEAHQYSWEHRKV